VIQTALAGGPVADPPSVVVEDGGSQPVEGMQVQFAITGGGGSLTGASQTTDASGVATVGSWNLGPNAGVNTLTATVAKNGLSGNPVEFSAAGTVTPPNPPTSVAAQSATTQTVPANTAVTDPPSVLVEDASQQPVAGVSVQFDITAGGGTLTGAIQVTNASGIATVGQWRLGPNAGANTLTATVGANGVTGNPVTFHATATAPVAPTVAWATYIGGTADDQARDMTTDQHGNVYVAGGTASNDFPTTPGAFDRTHDDSPNGTVLHYDVFVTKFDSTGHMVWSTYLGGPGYDRAYAIEVDAQGYVYIGGRAGTGFPVTPGAAQTTFAGGGVAAYGEEDGFVCKLKPDGSAPVFCTYFGTTDYNIVRDIDVDPQGNVYLASSTTVSYPASATYFQGSFQPTKHAGLDCVIAKLDASGSSFQWATYLGGSGDDGTQPSVRVDGGGNVWYLSGVSSANMPLANAAQGTEGGGTDLYLAKLSSDGKQLLVGTYLGGSGGEGSETHNLAVNRNTGDVYIGSGTSSTDLAVTPNALQKNFGGSHDALLARFNNSGGLLNLSYLGGSSDDDIEGITVGSDGRVYASGINMANHYTIPLVGPGGGNNLATLIFSADLTHVDLGMGVGGGANDTGRAVAPFPTGGIVAGGQVASTNMPTKNAEQPNYGGGTSDAWLVRVVTP
jgi:hypothetical protein